MLSEGLQHFYNSSKKATIKQQTQLAAILNTEWGTSLNSNPTYPQIFYFINALGVCCWQIYSWSWIRDYIGNRDIYF